VHYQRNVNFATKQLLDVTNSLVVPSSIDPFFFKVSWEEREKEQEDEERGFGDFERLRIDGLKYERLSIKKLTLERFGDEDEGEQHGKGPSNIAAAKANRGRHRK
jgi:hypothetical protein